MANVAAVRLKRLQHKQRRKVDFLARAREVEEQETQTAMNKNMEDQRGARADAGLSSRPNVSYGRQKK